jgi:hypothetical protein
MKNKLMWFFDFYLRYFLYNDKKIYRYHRYMLNKWNDKYKNNR